MSQQPQTAQIKDHLIRVAYMVMYCIIFYIAWFILIAIGILQLLSNIIFKNPNNNLTTFGLSLSIYIQQIVRFVTYNTEDKPFPLDSWPK